MKCIYKNAFKMHLSRISRILYIYIKKRGNSLSLSRAMGILSRASLFLPHLSTSLSLRIPLLSSPSLSPSPLHLPFSLTIEIFPWRREGRGEAFLSSSLRVLSSLSSHSLFLSQTSLPSPLPFALPHALVHT